MHNNNIKRKTVKIIHGVLNYIAFAEKDDELQSSHLISMKTMTNEGVERNQSDNVEEIYTWLDEVVSSGAKKNISRDFSDGVLMAEVLKVYYPHYVDSHNYTPANSIRTKKENWNTLNRKVFSKIEMKLSNTVINQLVNSQQGTIDKVLTDLKSKIEADLITRSSSSQKFDETDKEQKTDENEMLLKIKPSSPMQVATKASNIYFKISQYLKNVFTILGGWIITGLFFWTWIFRRSNKEWLPSVNVPSTISGFADTEELVSHFIYEQLKQELHQKVNTISTLNQRIAHLRKVLRIKNVRIAHLTLQISNPTDNNGNGRSVHSKRSSQLKISKI
ncbi:sperm flagellar protein 1 isoform X2 [Cephus cinctus]|uniref:Sperm flagellar protein 1 isoform X2 n=1 Tax=Cephus cinctus TaxID=211228 RepID=A0AAJ7RIU6_CEPCN|nr:sperm flagellar protein 1 isoform X2 [Cephus cinctus]